MGKIVFFICVNNEAEYKEIAANVEELICPEGVERFIVWIQAAEYNSEVYNSTAKQLAARYKVYIHKGMRIVNDNFISDLLKVFSDPNIAMVGFLGSMEKPIDYSWYKSRHQVGRVFIRQDNQAVEVVVSDQHCNTKVRVLDSGCFATQYNQQWREEFTSNYYSMLSYCEDYTSDGYDLVIPAQEQSWCYCEALIEPECTQAEKCKYLALHAPYLDIEHEEGPISAILYNYGYNSYISEGWRFFGSEGISIGDNVSIQKDAWFCLPFNNYFGEPRIVIGDGCNIGYRMTISAANKVVLEDDVLVAANVHITDHNHNYQMIGVSIKNQGISSMSDSVVIGRGSWLANNVVVAGNVKIGRGCVIAANSVVRSDIPPYCVAAGTPAKVVKAYDYLRDAWVSIKSDEDLQRALATRPLQIDSQVDRPLLTVGVCTYNRCSYLEKWLECVCQQVGNDMSIEILVSDNGSDDNTEQVVKKYQAKYANIAYYRFKKNVGFSINYINVLDNAKGRYMLSSGDDDYFAEGRINLIKDVLMSHTDLSMIMLQHTNNLSQVYIGNGINDYVATNTYWLTFISGLIYARSVYKQIKNQYKYKDFFIPQVYLQIEMLKRKGKFISIYDNIWRADTGQHKPSGYNFAKVFIQEYLDLLINEGKVEDKVLRQEKQSLFNNMVLPWLFRIRHDVNVGLALDGLYDIFARYYAEEPYYHAALAKMHEILD